MRRMPAAILVLASPALCVGCVERRIWIDSDPPGALVWVNDAQLGRTPVDVGILHEGVYDVRIEKDGFEPIVTGATVDGPLWDQFPIDFVVEVLPIDAKSATRWKFLLTRRDDSESKLLERAEALRQSKDAPSTGTPPPPPRE